MSSPPALTDNTQAAPDPGDMAAGDEDGPPIWKFLIIIILLTLALLLILQANAH